jgi:hypothetical protein
MIRHWTRKVFTQSGVEADTPPGQWVGPKDGEAEGFFLALRGVPLNYIVIRVIAEGSLER